MYVLCHYAFYACDDLGKFIPFTWQADVCKVIYLFYSCIVKAEFLNKVLRSLNKIGPLQLSSIILFGSCMERLLGMGFHLNMWCDMLAF